ncbi:ORF6C domain-containing protein [Intestinibacter bartlettii]|uniref:ORF6C domain-containing protein n=1 Tax=Intestinibacter bartlettii TaxID=261299 RepID=UPI0039F4751A
MDYVNETNNLVENLTVVENNEEFIPIYETDKGEKVVNGRELHQGLGVQRDFSHWIKDCLNSVDAAEKDFSSLKTESTGGRPSIDYILKLEIAKEICLVAGASPRANEFLKQKSKAYRKYLIQFEEKYKVNPYQNMSKELQAIFAIDKKQQITDERITAVAEDLKDFKENAPLFNIECEELQKALRAKVISEMGGKKSAAYNDKSLRTKVFSDAQRQIKREFGLTSYKAIKRSQFNKALEIIENYKMPFVLREIIESANSQITMENLKLMKAKNELVKDYVV